MVANNIVEIEGVNYAVVETFDIDNNKYALIAPMEGEEPNVNKSSVIRLEDGFVYPVDQEEEKQKVAKKLNELMNAN